MILSAPELLTPTRLTAILRAAGCIHRAVVTDTSFEAMGAGLLGDTARFNLSYDIEESGAPNTVAGKFPAKNEHARESAKKIGVYLIETRFYQEVRNTVRVRAPACYYAEINPKTHEFGLILEDMGPSRAANQLAGCSRDDAELALTQAAALHAPRFGDRSLLKIDWMKIRATVYGEVCENIRLYVDKFCNRFATLLEPEYLRVVEDFGDVAALFALKPPERFCLVHADFRLDNMLFEANGGQTPLVVLDWQSLTHENPGVDLAYFIATSYPIELRSRDERDFLRFYQEQMRALGAPDYHWDALWHDYRRGAWAGLMTAILASAVAKQTERGDQVLLRMARGSAAQMLDHATLSLA